MREILIRRRLGRAGGGPPSPAAPAGPIRWWNYAGLAIVIGVVANIALGTYRVLVGLAAKDLSPAGKAIFVGGAMLVLLAVGFGLWDSREKEG